MVRWRTADRREIGDRTAWTYGLPILRPGTGMQDGFRDRRQRYSYLVARETARRILADPGVIELGRRHLERFAKDDPSQAGAYRLWSRLLEQPAATIAERLLERSPEGDYTRETAPAFGHLPGPLRASLLREAGAPLEPPER